jgi:Cdc6-like AAA superfamily ATPase
LPASPKILHGRDEEISQLVNTLLQPHAAYLAVLGPGGIGKTSLALAALHNPETASKYAARRFWIVCDPANSAKDLVGLMATHFDLEKHGKLDKAVLAHLRSLAAPTLLVLDNLETPWEPIDSRSGVEDFLSHLADIEHLSLLVGPLISKFPIADHRSRLQ